MCILPDSDKELCTFDGYPLQYVFFVYSVEMVLKDFDIVNQKPINRTIMLSVRQKVIDEEDCDSDLKDVKKITRWMSRRWNIIPIIERPSALPEAYSG